MIYEFQIRGTDTNTDLQIQITAFICVLCFTSYVTFICEYFWDCFNPIDSFCHLGWVQAYGYFDQTRKSMIRK